ncbi:MAG: DNA polymerase III subunit gamma/tau [Methylococcaceae bacterium]|nr:DNA polymerase III subunit gamma/tau [Methylococcaceae bacterium]
MNYQVLARKWRPSNFSEVVGQDHVVKSLMNALQHDRLHHAYLFTGTRGVGKTTIARILAKAINCEDLKDFNPCGKCSVCRDFDDGRFMDLIEVDAASRTKVEDTRDLLDNAQYAPSHGRFKVYLIDEVHMLSGHSFNALLKTLEEPPAHVKFLLATTDPQKIPVTVLSRCLQFNLKRLLPDRISAQMDLILQQEHIDSESAALRLLARAADGSMRDGLSLLDQAIVYGNGKVLAEDVQTMLGTVARQPVEEILKALANGDAKAILAIIDEIATIQADFGDVLQQILQVLHRIAIVQQIPSAAVLDYDADMIAALARQFTPEDVQLYYQIGLIGQKDLDLAPDPKCGFEMIMLRMLTFKPVRPPANQAVRPPSDQSDRKKPSPAMTEKIAARAQQSDVQWSDMIAAMDIKGLTKELANNCVLKNIDEKVCTLVLDPGLNHLITSRAQENLQRALQTYQGASLKLTIISEKPTADTPAALVTKEREDRQQAAIDAIHSDETIQALKEQFGARIIPGTIEPV